MNTKIGTSFGLAALVAIAAIATMFALGVFSVKPVSAALGTVTSASTPTTAGAAAQHTVSVTGASSQAALTVGGTIYVKFDTKYTVPSSMASSTVKLKARDLSGTSPTGDQLVSAGAITVSGKVVQITLPDMDPSSTTNGDNGIAANSPFTIIFTQGAGVTNPKLAHAGRPISVKFSSDDTYVASTTMTAVTRSVTYTPTTAARGATVTVTGKGFTANCDDCKIRMNPQNATVPTTANEGSGTIDANGVFTGTIVTDASSNRTDNYIWVVDATGVGTAATTIWIQKAGATPTATSVTPGSTVTSTLVDFTPSTTIAAGTGNVTVGSNSTTVSNLVNTLDSNGNTDVLTPFKFTMPLATPVGSQKVTIDDGTKTATFNIDVVARTLTVTPNPAAIGQSITISGTGFRKDGSGVISTITGSTGADLQAGATINIGTDGSWSHTGTMDTLEASAARVSDAYTITATDNTVGGGLVGTSSGFKRTARTLTLSKATAAPGESFEVSVTGMTVDDGENATTAKFTMTISSGTLAGTTEFPVASDGTGTGTLAIPLAASVGTLTLTATDNADELNADATNGREAEATIKVAAGVISVDPPAAATGKIVTITGSGFPPSTTGSVLTFGTASGVPASGFASDVNGAFSFTTEVPASASGGSLSPGTTIVTATVGSITGKTTDFSIASPAITITPAEAAPEDTIVIEGTGFSALSAATTLNIGTASALPSPAPRANRSGDITANVEVPLLNPGTYTVVLTNKTGFTASATFKAVAAKAPVAANTDNTEVVFADSITADNLVRVWRFSNADQSWAFFDPRPAFEAANTLAKTGAGDIVWVNVTAEEEFQSATLFPGWNLISLK